MKGFRIITPSGQQVRFRYYEQEAPATYSAFAALLPFSRLFVHARLSGQEIWIDNAPPINVIQENASVFALPGEVVYGPEKAGRARTANCMGIYYGEGKGIDCCNIFACVIDEDRKILEELGNSIWKGGEQMLTITSLYSS